MVVRPEFAEEPEFRRRFAQEVANAQRIHGLYTAQVIDTGAEAESPRLVTAYVAGPASSRWCASTARWTKRLRDPARPDVLVVDDFAMREPIPAQADDLYELIGERTGQSFILTSNRAPNDWYPLFPNLVVAEFLLDRLINNSHQLFINGPSYWPNKRPGTRPTGTKTESGAAQE